MCFFASFKENKLILMKFSTLQVCIISPSSDLNIISGSVKGHYIYFT